MQTNRLFLRYLMGAVFILVLHIGLFSPVVQAQTFAGQSVLTEPPASLRAIITPVANSLVVRIRFENQGRGSVQLQIRDRKGTILLDELQPKRFYAGQFDLASLPAGLYTIELRTLDARHTDTIRIEPPLSGRVIAVSEPTATEKMIVKQ
ncbi:hypothetical protein [Spirosoma pulveris]